MGDDQQDEVDKLYRKFENDAHDKVRAETLNYRLVESGQPRNFLRNLVTDLMKFADKRLDAEYQVKLCLLFAADFYEFGEYALALENFEAVVARCDSIPNELLATKYRVEGMQKIVQSHYAELLQLKNPQIAPMVVSKLLLCLQKLRHSLENIFELPTRQQEGLAWMVLNGCKLIMEIGQPLIWHTCGKYVTETIMFGATAMEAVINLCTVRHMRFRMKMYSSVFYSALAHSVTDEAAGLLEHARKQVAELKEREELDPPVPKNSIACLQYCQRDLAVMKFALDFWKDPDSFSLADAHLAKYYTAPAAEVAVIEMLSFADLCASECIRVHLLAAGNTNEPFRKRSTCLLKGIAAALQGYSPSTASSGEEKRDVSAPDATRTALYEKFTPRGMLESAVLALFYGVEGVDAGDILIKCCSLGMEIAAHQQQASGAPSPADPESVEQLQLLLELHRLTKNTTPGAKRAKQVLRVVQNFDRLVYSTYAYRTRAVMKKVSMELWRSYLYPAVQEILSDLQNPDSTSPALLAEIAPGLLTAVKLLDIAGLEDPILMGATALISAQVQWELGDQRGSIALVQQAIFTLDEHRMGRVDALQHIPEDVRDILALQRGSFTTRGDSQDWFHSVKRLGAHAFAGYGIFGLSSSADRGDQAMAEVQADLAAFYFRVELAYCVTQLAEKHRIRSILAREEKLRTAAADALLQGIKLKPMVDKGATKNATVRVGSIRPATMGTMDLSVTLANSALFAAGLNVESLPVLQSLRAFCAKNSYYKCILFIEMARIDTDPERRSSYLHDALNAIEECEGREQLLKESFAELMVMTESTRRPPLVVARSHRYVYVAPAGCRKLKKAAYYRIFAKEKGSGTDVSIHNDDIAGCEHRVQVQDLHNLRNSVVRIGPLRAGEQYVFGCAAFTSEDKVTGGLSPTSVVVDAVNPLPTIVLWNWLTQIAEENGFWPLVKEVSARVVNRYFMLSPTPESRVIGKGVNLFLFREPSLCMLALQQSSPLLLQCFVDSCLSYEKLYQGTHIEPHNRGNWTKDRSNQLSAMTSLHRTALVCTVACGIQNYELTLRTVKLGYDVALELVRFETVHLAGYLQGPLTVLVMAMQTTPKRHWGSLEHKLYTKLLAHAVKVAVIAKNVTPVIAVLNGFYPEVLSTSADEASAARPKPELLADYSALLRKVLQSVHSSHLGQFVDTMRKLPTPFTVEAHANRESDPATATGVGYLWSLSPVARKLQLTNCAVDLLKPPDEKATPDRVALEKWLTVDRPQRMSDYLESMVQIATEVARSSQAADLHKLVQRMPLCVDFLASRAVEIIREWNLPCVQTLSQIVSQASVVSPRTAAAKKPPTKGAPPEPTEAELQAAREALLKVPERFLEVSPEEQALQCQHLGQLLSILAVQSLPGAGKAIDHFPKSATGPKAIVDPNVYVVDRTVFQGAAGATDGAASAAAAADTSLPVPTSPRAPLFPASLSAVEYVRVLGGAADLLREAGANYAAAQVACSLWRYVVSAWKDPHELAVECAGAQDHLLRVLRCLTVLLEQMSFVVVPAVLEDEGSIAESVSPSVHQQLLESVGGAESDAPLSRQREVKETMLILRDLYIFWVKVEWIVNPANWDLVQLGSRAFRTMLLNCPEYLKEFGDNCLPLIMNAQEAWIDKAQKFLAQRNSELENFVFQYEEAQRKKRKKKLRVARLEKDEEELLFEAERAVYQQRVEAAQQALDLTHEEMAQVKIQQAKFNRLASAGSRAFDKVKASCRLFMDDVRSTAANHPSGPITNSALLLQLYPDLDEKLHALQLQFKPVFSVLREKKEKVLLVEALKLLGDVLLYFHRIAEAKSVWNDAIDGLFNVMDACTEWKTVAADAVASLEPQLIPGILPAVVVLSKLSRFCASQDWDAKAGYARMAAELCRIPFQGSFGHPLSVVGFAAYQCLEVGGVLSLGQREEALSATDLVSGLNEVLQVLICEKQYIAGLPVVVLLEHYCAVYLNNPSLWLSARMLRLRLLVGAHLFAEAAAMLASVRFTVQEIHRQTFADAMRNQYSQQNENLKEFETSENALNFHGYAAYFNNLGADDETRNAAALQWIAAFPVEFESFAKSFKIPLPPPVLTPEEAAAEAERKAKAAEEAAAAAAAAKKGKGKGKEAEVAVVEEVDTTSVPMFTPLQISEMHITVAHFLLEIAMLDARSTVPHAAKLQKFGTQGLDALAKAASGLFALLPTPAAADPSAAPAEELLNPSNLQYVRNKDWLRLYGRVHLLRNAYNLHLRNLKEVRAACVNMLTLLRGPALAQGLSGDVRGVLTQLWLATKDDLITVADRQARFQDVIQLSNESAREASMQLAGFWLRSYLLHRAQANFKLGHMNEALADCKTCINQFEINKLEDASLVRCLCLQATVQREQALYAPKAQCVQAYLDCLSLLRRAMSIADTLAQRAGAFPADSNVTYGRADTAIKNHHMIAPVLQSLTDLHANEPNLSLQPQFNKKKLHQHMGIDIPSLNAPKAAPGAGAAPSAATVSGKDISTTLSRTSLQGTVAAAAAAEAEAAEQSTAQKYKLNSLRLAPVDRKEGVYCESEYANIYLEENRVLLGCQNLLCQVLDDARNAGLEGNPLFQDVYEPNDLVNEQLALGESSLKLARHCLYLPAAMRISTLAYVGKARIAKKSKFEGNAAEFLGTLVGPLTAALEVSVQSHSSQLWALLRAVCIELVEVYGDHDLDLGDEVGPQRLKMAVVYLLAAIKVSNQQATLTKASIGLATDASFDAITSDELKRLVVNLSSSSATPDPDEMKRLAAAEAEAAAVAAKAPPAKGKPKAAPAAAGSGSTLAPSGRDALYLLCALLRERDPLWMHTAEQLLCADLHSLLRTSYPLYSTKCCLTECPNPSGPVEVPCASVSTLWFPTKAPNAFSAVLERQPNQFDYSTSGLYSHASVFFLFGDAVLPTAASTAAGETGNSKEPILTKLVLPRVDCAYIEKALRSLRDRLMDAEKKNYTSVIRACQNDFGDLLVLLLGLLKNGIITQEKPGSVEAARVAEMDKIYTVTESKGAAGAPSSYDLALPVGDNAVTVVLKVTADLLLHFAEVMCVDKDRELLKNNYVCAFFRAALGYKVLSK